MLADPARPQDWQGFAACAKGIAPLLADELRAIGLAVLREHPAGVRFAATPVAEEAGVPPGAAQPEGEAVFARLHAARDGLLRAVLWLRTASRVGLLLGESSTAGRDAEGLKALARQIDWPAWLAPGAPFLVRFSGSNANLRSPLFAAQLLKDAIRDAFRPLGLAVPELDPERPTWVLDARLRDDAISLSLDLGGSLHQRGYRIEGGAAPLRETLAAALLLRAGWPGIAAAGGALVDPLCGSGTLLFEGLMMAADWAPGLQRPGFAAGGWAHFDAAHWQALCQEAEQRREAGLARLPPICGRDADARALQAARHNAERLGVMSRLQLELARLETPLAAECRAEAPEDEAPGDRDEGETAPPGLAICNPPYGARLGDEAELAPLYQALGAWLLREWAGGEAAVFTGHPGLGRELGLKAERRHEFFNGSIACQLLRLAVPVPGETTADAASLQARRAERRRALAESAGARMFANRVEKNRKGLKRWLKDEGVDCYRVYAADMPEYNFALDLYTEAGSPAGYSDAAAVAGRQWLNVQEYAAPGSVAIEAVRRRRAEALAVLPELFDLPPERIWLRTRTRGKGGARYAEARIAPLSGLPRFADPPPSGFWVREAGAWLWVDLGGHLDTGLFLDHRPVRAWLAEAAAGRRVLNLFCYTGSATVQAALGGAQSSLSVDLSRTYLDWAARNLAANGLDPARHRLLRADVPAWLREQAGLMHKPLFDLVFVDPPSFSSSSRAEGSFDVQRDHAALLRDIFRLLVPGGVVYFSSNLRDFQLDIQVMDQYQCRDDSRASIPPDFARNPRIHRLFRLQRPEVAS